MQSALTPDTALLLQQASQSDASGTSDFIKAKNAERAKDAAQEFEAVFLSEMLKPMFDGLETNEVFGGGKSEEIFRSMMIDEYGKEIADKDITGIQTQVMNKLIEIQEQRTQRAEGNVLPTTVVNSPITDLEFVEETVK